MLLPRAEELIAIRIKHGILTRFRRCRDDYQDLIVNLPDSDDLANLADVEGDHNIILNIDMCHYVWDTYGD